jgi:hypothetical protein
MSMAEVNSREGWVCRPCRLAEKKVENARAAAAEGRSYKVGARKGFRHGYRPETIADSKWRSVEEANAKQAWVWWLDHAPAWWLEHRNAMLATMAPPTYQERYRSDLAFRRKEIQRVALRKKARGRFDEYVRYVLKGQATEARMRDVLGYGRAELLGHLVEHFTPGMTLAALLKGDIHIDHDDPVIRYNTHDLAQLHELWRLANVRPMWPKDNASKSSRTLVEWKCGAKAQRVTQV